MKMNQRVACVRQAGMILGLCFWAFVLLPGGRCPFVSGQEPSRNGLYTRTAAQSVPVPTRLAVSGADSISGIPALAGSNSGVAPTAFAAYPVAEEYLYWPLRYGGIQKVKVYYPSTVNHRCPVIVFSHGLGGSAETCAYLGRMWASRGLVSVHLDHPGSNDELWRGTLRTKALLQNAYQEHWNGRDRALAIRFAIDRLAETAKGKGANGQIGALLDLDRIGVAGNDLGALGAMLAAGQVPPDNGSSLKDDRVKAVLALSPPVFCNAISAPLVYEGIKVPFMSFNGTQDDGVIGTTKAWQRRIPFDSVSGVDRYHITLQGADHLVYSGVRPRGRQLRQSSTDPVFQKTIMEVSTAFWAMYLQKDDYAAKLLRRESDKTTIRAAVLERHLR